MAEKLPPLQMDAEIDLGEFHGDTKRLVEALEKLDPSLKRTEDGMKRVEKASRDAAKGGGLLQSTFGRLTASFTAADLAADGIRRTLRLVKDAFVGSVKGAIDFEAQLVRVRKVTGATKAEMADLKKFIQDLAVTTGIQKSELTDIAASGGQLGIFNREGMEGLQSFTRVIAMSRVALEDYAGSSDEAAKKTAQLLNLFGLAAKDSEVLLSVINELSNTSAATSANIADNATSFASLSQTFDASKESILALAATMEEVGAEPQAFSTALQTALINMQGDVDRFASFLGDDLGKQFKETFAEEPIEAFAIFLRGLNKAGRDVGKVLDDLGIGDARMIRELAKLSTDKGLERFAQNLENAERASGEAEDAVNGLTDAASSLQREFETASETSKRHLASLGEAASNTGQSFGDGFLPVINEISDSMIGWLQESIPLARALGETLGDLLATAAAAGASFGNAIGRAVNFGAAMLRQPFEDLGLAEKGAASRLAKDALTGTDPGAEMLKRIKDARKIADEVRKQVGFGGGGGGIGDFETGGSSGGAGGGAAKDMEKTLRDIEKAEQDIVRALGDQAKANMDNLKLRKTELELKKQLGILTDREAEELRRINNRYEFQDEKIKEITKEWEDQVKAIEDVEEKVKDLNERIAEEREELRKTLADIDADSKEDALQSAAELIQERNRIREEASGASGLSGDQSRRLGEIDESLSGFNQSTLAEAEGLAGMSPGELIEREKEMRREAATERANARIAELQAELSAEQQKLETLRQAEAEKKQIVISALEERRVATLNNYQIIEQATKLHVDNQIAEFQRLQAALSAANSFSASPSIPGFADGGVLTGPGGPRSDNLLIAASPGERIISAATNRLYGPILDAIHRREFPIPRFAEGGMVNSNNTTSKSAHFHYHGEQARAMANPSMLEWQFRKMR